MKCLHPCARDTVPIICYFLSFKTINFVDNVCAPHTNSGFSVCVSNETRISAGFFLTRFVSSMRLFTHYIEIFRRFNRKLSHRNVLLCVLWTQQFCRCDFMHCTFQRLNVNSIGSRIDGEINKNAVRKEFYGEKNCADKYQFRMRINWYFIFRITTYSFICSIKWRLWSKSFRWRVCVAFSV